VKRLSISRSSGVVKEMKDEWRWKKRGRNRDRRRNKRT